MKFYIASGFQNKHLVRFVSSQLKEVGWQHTYDWTKNERATNREQLQKIGEEEQEAIREADVFLLILEGGNGSHTELGMAIALEKKIYIYITRAMSCKRHSTIYEKLIFSKEKLRGLSHIY